jgi:alpha-L-rhamnosidase
MNKFFLLGIIALLMSCSTNHQNINLNEDLNGVLWISDDKVQPTNDSLFYLDDYSPLFRKEFKSENEIESAKLYITAAGYYAAFINGTRIGIDVLSPAWTDFSKRVYYSEYDISSDIVAGENCLGVTLGNGFYNPLPLKMWGSRNLREVLPVGNPVFIAKLLIRYKNGKTKEITTDNTWKFEFGPLAKNNVYLGEVYDSRKELNGWGKAGFKDNLWKNAIVSNGPGGKLQKAFFPPVQVTDTISPVGISLLKDDIIIVDMGVNFTGTYNMKLSGKKDDTITFRFGERLYENGTLNPMTTVCGQIKRKGMGGPGAPDIAWQTDSYILKLY